MNKDHKLGKLVSDRRLAPINDIPSLGNRYNCRRPIGKDTSVQIAIVEDDPQTRSLLKALLDTEPSFCVVMDSDSMEHFLWDARHVDHLDLVLLDIELPGMNGIRGASMVRDRWPEADIVMLTVYENWDYIFKALQAGASGYLLKSSPLDQIVQSLHLLREGGAAMTPQIAMKLVKYFHPDSAQPSESDLTDRQKEVVAAILDGLSYKEIADRLCVSLGTVHSHIKRIYRKLNVHSKGDIYRLGEQLLS